MSHTFGVSFDKQYILISTDIKVNESLAADSVFYMECEKKKTKKLKDTHLLYYRTTIRCNDQVVGEFVSKAQAVSHDVYNTLRWKH
jgi:hypothetical protein